VNWPTKSRTTSNGRDVFAPSRPFTRAAPKSNAGLRGILRAAMAAEGFTVYPPEWWHSDYEARREYPILNISFSEIGQGRGAGSRE
jgi:D-alanyl-D-alanine dipeptidase